MTQTVPVSIRLTPEKASLLDEMAKQGERSRNNLINLAIDTYLEMHEAWVDGIEAAIRQDDSGLTFPADEVFQRVRGRFWKSN